jgi:cytochrome c2
MKQAVLSLSAAVLLSAAMLTSCASQASAERPAARQRAENAGLVATSISATSANASGSVVLAAAPAAAEPTPAGAPAPQEAKGDAAKGKETFEQCGICHAVDSDEEKMGPALKGLFKKAKLKNGKEASEANVRAIVKAGGNGMPGYEELLSAEEMENLIAYLKTV